MNEVKSWDFWWVRILMSEPKTDDDKAIRMNKEQEKSNQIRARGMICGGFLVGFCWLYLFDLYYTSVYPSLKREHLGGATFRILR